jgi:hypothetical protein
LGAVNVRAGLPCCKAPAGVHAGGLWYNPRNIQRYGPIIPDNPNWHRSKGWCPYYRERWAIGQEPDGQGGRLLYQIICLNNTPPESEAEQAECMKTRSKCWRDQPARKSARKKTAATAAK